MTRNPTRTKRYADRSSVHDGEGVEPYDSHQGSYLISNPYRMKTRRTPIRPDTWAGVVLSLLKEAECQVPLPALYELVEQKATSRLATVPTWKATVRRTVQDLRDWGLAVQVTKGVWQYRAEQDTAAPVPEQGMNETAA